MKRRAILSAMLGLPALSGSSGRRRKLVAAEAGKKIPLAIGFANLSGDDLGPLLAEDVEILAPLFEAARVPPPHQVPGTAVLFVYAYLEENGTIHGTKGSGIRQIIELTQSKIVVVASPNSGDSIKNAAGLPGRKSANIVFTLDRKKDGFGKFFRALFEKMRDGEEMLLAWVELAPQGPVSASPDLPATILLAEAGKLRFPNGR